MINAANTKQTEHFENLSEQWWNESGAFGVLHAMNPLRVKFIKDAVQNYAVEKDFKKINLLDVGCGGGILCEALARLNANVTGIDASIKAIDCAKEHAAARGLSINYINTNVDELAKKYDLITCLEVMEHVDDVELFCQQLVSKLKTKGILVISTINKTILSYLVGILGAEYITGMVPVGTHNWLQFIEPADLINIFLKNGLSALKMSGLSYSLIKRNWYLSDSFNINYIIALQAD